MAGRRHLTKRDGIFHYFRRVPKRYQAVDPRGFVEVSLDTRDERIAERRKPEIAKAVEALWEARLLGTSDEAEDLYQSAIQIARLEGFDYKPSAAIARSPIDDVLARLERLEQKGVADEPTVRALLGGRDAPAMSLRRALAEFFDLTRDRQMRKTKDQLRRWKNPRQKAVENFCNVVGDMPVIEIRRSHALVFRAWWVDRMQDEGLTANSVNKDIGHLSQILNTVSEAHELELPPVFAKLRLTEDRRSQRAAFETDWIVTRLLADGALGGLNTEARLIVLCMVETGLRLGEACNLDRSMIRLDGDIPHVDIRPTDERRLKTPYSERMVPLIGVSLEALQQAPSGFPRYADSASGLSALVNKFMRDKGLMPSDNHTLYSLRHSFADRLTATDASDMVHTALMGHKLGRPMYGEGPTLAHKYEWIKRVAVSV